MNNTDPQVLDLWIADMISRNDESKQLVPAEKAFQQVAEKWQISAQ